MFALAEGSSWGWASTATILLFLVGIVLLAPLLVYERSYSKRGGEPILNLRLLAVRNVVAANVSFMGTYIGMVLALYTYIFKFENPQPAGFNLDIFKTGLSLVPLAASILILIDRFRAYLLSKYPRLLRRFTDKLSGKTDLFREEATERLLKYIDASLRRK